MSFALKQQTCIVLVILVTPPKVNIVDSRMSSPAELATIIDKIKKKNRNGTIYYNSVKEHPKVGKIY
jgi:hypothetical protein